MNADKFCSFDYVLEYVPLFLDDSVDEACENCSNIKSSDSGFVA